MKENSRKIHLGFSIIELIVTVLIVAILATTATPMLQLNQKRMKEAELRTNLRQIREAIDAYKAASDKGYIQKEATASGYPTTLQALTRTIDQTDSNGTKVLRFIRKIPSDPMRIDTSASAEASWGLRSYDSEPDQPQPGRDVYDIYSKSEGLAIDGTKYRDW